MTVQTNTVRAILRKHAADDDSAVRATSVDEEFKGLRVFQESLAALDIASELLERAPYSSKAKTPYLQLTVIDPSANDEDDEDAEDDVILLDLEFVEQQVWRRPFLSEMMKYEKAFFHSGGTTHFFYRATFSPDARFLSLDAEVGGIGASVRPGHTIYDVEALLR